MVCWRCGPPIDIGGAESDCGGGDTLGAERLGPALFEYVPPRLNDTGDVVWGIGDADCAKLDVDEGWLMLANGLFVLGA